MEDRVLQLLSAQKGHFLLESGHHGDLWFDLETLCLHPAALQALAAELAEPLAARDVDVVCGALVEGAFVALLVALQLGKPFVYAERFARPSGDGLFPAGYRIPAVLRAGLRGKRVALVNDVINAGSAVRGTYFGLKDCGAEVVDISALLVLGDAFPAFAAEHGVALHSLAAMPNHLWTPDACPLCAQGLPLEDRGAYAASLAGH